MKKLPEAAALQAALETAYADRNRDSVAFVQLRTQELVDALKDDGWPIEAVILEIKRVADAPGGPIHQPRIVADAVSWGIKQYYQSAPR